MGGGKRKWGEGKKNWGGGKRKEGALSALLEGVQLLKIAQTRWKLNKGTGVNGEPGGGAVGRGAIGPGLWGRSCVWGGAAGGPPQ